MTSNNLPNRSPDETIVQFSDSQGRGLSDQGKPDDQPKPDVDATICQLNRENSGIDSVIFASGLTEPKLPATLENSVADGTIVQPIAKQVDGTIVQPIAKQVDGTIVQPIAKQVDGTIVQPIAKQRKIHDQEVEKLASRGLAHEQEVPLIKIAHSRASHTSVNTDKNSVFWRGLAFGLGIGLLVGFAIGGVTNFTIINYFQQVQDIND